MQDKIEVKELVLDGEGQVTFTIDGDKFEVEVFQQGFLKETLTAVDKVRLRNWLMQDLIDRN